MKISVIAALAENRVIGRDQRLPWRLPADLRHFRSLTLGKPVVMGRKTFESLGRPLPERLNIVLTSRRDLAAKGCILTHSIEEALAAAGSAPELMVIGGSELYSQFLPLADRMYLTLVHGWFEGDALFPEYDTGDWLERSREDHPSDDRHSCPYSFLVLERQGS